ncbi:unnamed protein product [Brachionus calyciflorus]|uniref:NIDO domain-containing protein n=1 Tax=Brachionus calyciflorus TaxID=104777 RepID=A0A814FMX5_9BILA|nr:unnamed protein product [Brachionus calyciflorus]
MKTLTFLSLLYQLWFLNQDVTGLIHGTFGLEYSDIVPAGDYGNYIYNLSYDFPYSNRRFRSITVSIDGYVILGSDFIFVYHCNFDTQISGVIYVEKQLKASRLTELSTRIVSAMPKYKDFNATNAFSVTWYRLPYYLNLIGADTFQIILITDGYESFIALSYESLAYNCYINFNNLYSQFYYTKSPSSYIMHETSGNFYGLGSWLFNVNGNLVQKYSAEIITGSSQLIIRTEPVLPKKGNIKPKWTLYKYDELTLNEEEMIEVNSNHKSNDSSFDLSNNNWDYGFYKFVLSLDTNLSRFENVTDFTYLKKVPSRLVVRGLANGIESISIARDEILKIDPLNNSFDSDRILNITLLNFKFYCFYVNINESRPEIEELFDRRDLIMETNNSCFKTSNGYIFENNNNTLIIKKDALKFDHDKKQLFLITTIYGTDFFQYLTASIDPKKVPQPIVFLKCKVLKSCEIYSEYQIISEANDILLETYCQYGCQYIDSIIFTYEVYKKTSILGDWLELDQREMEYVSGNFTKEFNIQSALFNISSFIYLKIELTTTITSLGYSKSSKNISLFKKNSKPFGGECIMDKYNGTSLETNFTITCNQWTDSDGFIARYEYYGLILLIFAM